MKSVLINFPHCDEYQDNSFTGIWHEEGLLNIEKYWEFEKGIFDLSKIHSGDSIPRDVAWPITRIFSYIMMGIQAHYNSNDGFIIINKNDEELHQFRERFQLVVEGFFKGVMPQNNHFDIINPIL